MSKTIERIEEQERLFKRMLRNRARRLLFRSRRTDMIAVLGLLEEEEACERRGGIYCLLGLRTDMCILCSGLVGEVVRETPTYDELVQQIGDPYQEPELVVTPAQVEEEKPARRSTARRKGVRSKATAKTSSNKEE